MTLAVRRPLLQRLGDAVKPWLYSAPALIFITAVMLVPLVVGVSYAFRDVQILNPPSTSISSTSSSSAVKGSGASALSRAAGDRLKDATTSKSSRGSFDWADSTRRPTIDNFTGIAAPSEMCSIQG